MKHGKGRYGPSGDVTMVAPQGSRGTRRSPYSAARLIRITLSVLVILLPLKLAIDAAGRVGLLGSLFEEVLEASIFFSVLAWGCFAARTYLSLPAVRRAVLLVWLCVAVNQLCDVGEKVQALDALPVFGMGDSFGNILDAASGFGIVAALFVAFYLATLDSERRSCELRDLNETMRAAQSMAKVGYWNYDIATQESRWSEQMFAVFGIDPGNGAPELEEFQKIWNPSDWEVFDGSTEACIREGRPYDIVARIISPDGATRQVHTQGFPRTDREGNIVELFGTSQDITESRAMEAELRESEERSRLAQQASKTGVWERNLETDEVHWSENVASLFGIAPGTFGESYDSYLNAILPEDRVRVEREIAAALKAGEGFRTDYRVACPDGGIRWLTDEARFFKDSQGKTTRLVGTVRDVTDLKRIETELTTHRKHLEQTVVARTGQIEQARRVSEAVSEVLQETLRCETEEELGKTCLAIAERLTDSRIGILLELNPRGLLDTTAVSNPGWDECAMAVEDARQSIQDMEVRGIDRSTVREGVSRIVNGDEFATHPDRVGVPEGHPEITAFLGVPLKHEGKSVGMIGLGNKEGGYSLADQSAVETLSVAVLEALRRKRAEVALRKRGDELRKMVTAMAGRETRMAGLKRTIEELRRQIEEVGLVPVADDPLNEGGTEKREG